MNDSERDQLLGRLDERTDAILKRLESGDRCIKDHETRIGKLEGFQNTMLGIAATISLAITVFGNWALSHFRGA